MTMVYGIANCTTVKKARTWLEKQGIEYRFHDFRKDGLAIDTLQTFVTALSWEVLLNRSGMTWRKLPEQAKANLNEKQAMTLMLNYPTVIKRPVLVTGKKYHTGFTESDYQRLFPKKK